MTVHLRWRQSNRMAAMPLPETSARRPARHSGDRIARRRYDSACRRRHRLHLPLPNSADRPSARVLLRQPDVQHQVGPVSGVGEVLRRPRAGVQPRILLGLSHPRRARPARRDRGRPMESMLIRLSIPGQDEDGGPGRIRPMATSSTSAPSGVAAEGRVSIAIRGMSGPLRRRRTPLSCGARATWLISPTARSGRTDAVAARGAGRVRLRPVRSRSGGDPASDRRSRRRRWRRHLRARQQLLGAIYRPRNRAVRLEGKSAEFRQQNGGARRRNIGLTTAFAIGETERPAKGVQGLSDGGRPELSGSFSKARALCMTLAVPAQRMRTTRNSGQAASSAIGCAACHIRALRRRPTRAPQLVNQTIHPFTDLLLHDMGDGLADRRPDGDAGGSEWRTPPLWGIGLIGRGSTATTGCCTTAARAVWRKRSSGTAARRKPPKRNFRTAPKDERDALIAFLNSL